MQKELCTLILPRLGILQPANTLSLHPASLLWVSALLWLTIAGQTLVAVPSDTSQLSESASQTLEAEFLGFSPTDPEAMLGLDYIYAGRAFRPNGIPLSLVSNLYSLRRLTGQRHISLYAGKDQLEVFGKLPSPPTRKVGLGPQGRDFTLSNSVIELQPCYDKEGRRNTDFYPLDEFSKSTSCDNKAVFGVTNNSAQLWHHNCFQCHAGTVGKYVVGGAHANYSNQFGLSQELKLLSEFVDDKLPPADGDSGFQMIKVAFTRLLFGMNELEEESLDHFLDYARTELIPTFKWGKSAGDNMGPFTSYKGMGRLKADGDGYRIYKRTEFSPTDSKVFQDDTLFTPNVDAMPWWLLKFKNHVFWTGDNQVTKVRQFMYAFTFQHKGIASSHEPHVKRLGLALSYAEKLHSPKYPYKLDWDLVESGREIFHSKRIEKRSGATCSSCHGSYTQSKPKSTHWKVNYPGVIKSVTTVGTDNTYSQVSNHISSGIQDLLADARNAIAEKHGSKQAKSYGPRLAVARKRGVIPPPLVGLWASPPYFHNGSVPTVYHVLRASERPKTWTRPTALANSSFDPDKLGFKLETPLLETPMLDANRSKASSADTEDSNQLLLSSPISRKTSESMLTYHTAGKGRGNQGHSFVDDWPAEDINAVLEFLKSLSGPNVLPADPKKMGVKFNE